MTKRRKLVPKTTSSDATPAETPVVAPSAKSGGFWGGSAINLLQKRLDATSTEIVERIAQGLIVVELDPGQIDDDRGSDRQNDWKSQESLKSLVDDIGRRGQSQPIQVRPADPEWTPDPENPLDFSETRFVIQSGRRRLESCRILGKPVKAIIRTDQADALRMDLEERFLENTVRRDLSAFEELLSIGLIAQARENEEQKAIAEELHVTPSDVSLGLACLEFFDTIVAEYEVDSLAKRDFRRIIPELRKREKGGRRAAKPNSQVKGERLERSFGGLTASATRSRNGFSVTIKGWKGNEEALAKHIDAFMKTLSDT